MNIIELIKNTDDYLLQMIEANLLTTYIILFVIIFLESGVILFPFLPGDGLLFSIGVVSAISPLNIFIIIPLLILASIFGFLFNYQMGFLFGTWLTNNNFTIINKYYEKTKVFISKNGSKAVVISRFFPIVRTYIPFVAGAVTMNYKVFVKKTVFGAVLWISFFTISGYTLGEIDWIKKNYGFIFLGLIILTLIPFFLQLSKSLFYWLKIMTLKK